MVSGDEKQMTFDELGEVITKLRVKMEEFKTYIKTMETNHDTLYAKLLVCKNELKKHKEVK